MAYNPASVEKAPEVKQEVKVQPPAPVKAEVKKPVQETKTVVKTVKKKYKVNGKTHYRKAKAAYTYRKVRRGGVDCWVMSSRIYSQLTASGQKARVIQYATSMSPRHRSVQVYKNGAWVNYDYGGYSSTYRATGNSVNGKVV